MTGHCPFMLNLEDALPLPLQAMMGITGKKQKS